jgi:hypothetical protein
VRVGREQDRARPREVRQVAHRPRGDDRAAERAKQADHRVDQPLGATNDDRPRRDVPDEGEHQRDGPGEQVRQRLGGVAGAAGEQRSGALVREAGAEPGRGQRPHQPEPRHRERGPGNAERSEQIGEQGVRVGEQRLEHPPVPRPVAPEALGGRSDRRMVQDGRLVVERVGERHVGRRPPEPVRRERQPAQVRGDDRHRQARGAAIVREPRQGEGLRARAAAGPIRGFDDRY